MEQTSFATEEGLTLPEGTSTSLFSVYDTDKFDFRWKNKLWRGTPFYSNVIQSGILFFLLLFLLIPLPTSTFLLSWFSTIFIILLAWVLFRYYKQIRIQTYFVHHAAIQLDLPGDDHTPPMRFAIVTDEQLPFTDDIRYLRDYDGTRYRIELTQITDRSTLDFQPTPIMLFDFDCRVILPTLAFTGTLDAAYPGTYHVTGITTPQPFEEGDADNE
jgi:hypothetical protein